MKSTLWLSLILSFLSGCAAMRRPSEPSFNQRMLQEQIAAREEAKTQTASNADTTTGDLTQSSLWARSLGSPYIIRNQRAQSVGDLLTILVSESAEASTSANTKAKRDGSVDIGGTLSGGQGASDQWGTLTGTASHKNDFKGEGSTDRQ